METKKKKGLKSGLKTLYMIVYINLNKISLLETTSESIVFQRLKKHRNFFAGIVFNRKSTKQAFERAEMIIKNGIKGEIIDIREGL